MHNWSKNRRKLLKQILSVRLKKSIEKKRRNEEKEDGDNLSTYILKILPEVTILPCLVIISLVKVDI